MSNQKPKIAVGVICYNESSAKYLPFFLPSLRAQVDVGLRLFVADNSDPAYGKNRELVMGIFPDTDYEHMQANVGFAKAYNRLIDKAGQQGFEYFLVINNDTLLEPDMLKKLFEVLNADKNLSSVTPKIKHWDFEKREKTNIIDSCGIVMPKILRFSDLGQAQDDNGDFDNKDILGPSGACGLFRIDALTAVADKHGIYDERMFMYKEDCDLAYRLQRAGYTSKLVKEAVIYHDRTLSRPDGGLFARFKERHSRSRNLRTWSFLNQQLIFVKHWSALGIVEKLSVIAYQCKLLAYVLPFEPFLLLELFKVRLSWCKKS